ncbi:MAG: hypothetical protein GY777_32915 [Candidatus Brocadiaceae bacterium]|nr:hypothetical protein [Candidatus Brocadiaceae bacterium]
MKDKSLNIILLAASLSVINGCSKQATAQESSNSIANDDIQTEITVKSSTRIKLLNESTQWIEFRKIWQKLDAIKPTSEDDNFFGGNYMHSLSYEEAEKYRTEISRSTEQLFNVGETLLTEEEIEILRELSLSRVDYLSNGRTSMMTRMIVFESYISTEQSLVDLENQIDQLIILKKNDTISQNEYNQALENINTTIQRITIINLITTHFGPQINFPFSSNRNASNQIEHESSDSILNRYALEFENNYQQFKERIDDDSFDSYDELERKYETTRNEIQKLKTMYPRFKDLIYNLEV